jgi:hypothetical protein
MAAPRKCPLELKERAPRLWRSEQPRPHRRRPSPGQTAEDEIVTPAGPACQRRGGRIGPPPCQTARRAAPTGLAWDDHGLVFPQHRGQAPAPLQLPAAELLSAAGAGRAPAGPLPRPAPQRGNATAWPWHPSQDRERDARPQPDRHHPGSILPRHGYHAARGRTCVRRAGWQAGGSQEGASEH